MLVHRSSIFDDNILKYGEIVIKTKSGKLKKLSKYLTDSGFAYESVSEFHAHLSSGKLKTKLSKVETQEIIKKLENYHTNSNKPIHIWKNAIKKQTSVFQTSLNFESSLTLSNLEKQNRFMNKMLKDRQKDFELCKDIDEESVGRSSRNRIKKELMTEADESLNRSKKLSKTQKPSNAPAEETKEEAYNKVRNFLKDNTKDENQNQTHDLRRLNSHSKPDDTIQNESLLSKKFKLLKKLQSNSENDENKVKKNAADVRKFLESTQNDNKICTVDEFETEQRIDVKETDIRKADQIEKEVELKRTLNDRFAEMARFDDQHEDKTRSTNHFQEMSRNVSNFKERGNISKQFEKRHGKVDSRKTGKLHKG